MKNILYKLSLIAIVSASISSCRDALVIEPRQSIDATTALTSKDGINAAVVSVYSRFKSVRLYGRDLIAFPEALSDNGFATNKSGRLLPEANNVYRAHFGDALWSAAYNGINQANLIIETVPGVTAAGITPADKTSWLGQMYFLRALYYFDMVKVFSYMPGATVAAQDKGGIPLILKGVATSEDALALKPSRASVDDVYKQIIADLLLAESNLTTTGLPNFASKTAAQAMLSRVYLYMKDYANAKRWADACIAAAGTRLSSAAAYVGQWRGATHVESLFQFVLATNAENNGVNESLQTSFTTLTAPGNTTVTGGFGDLVPSLSLMSELGITLTGGNTTGNFNSVNATIASRSSDVRNLLYEPGTTGRGSAKVECTKYIGKNGFINLDNLPIIRIAEVYLNRAEAMSTPGSAVFNESAALADVNTIATNRGLTAFSGLTGSALYEEVLRQRRLELAFEGHRFFDLKRLGRDLVKAPHYNTVAFTDVRILAPLPTREVDGNKNLVQNSGY
ncbi:MAG: hypothetical protein RL131_672 [Bacteroidota bacterium]